MYVCLSLLFINYLSVKHFVNNRLTHGFPPAMLVRRGSNPGGCKSTIQSRWLIMSYLSTEIILSSPLTVLYTTTVLCFSNLLLHTSHSAQHYTATHNDIWWMALKQCPVLQSQSLWIHGIFLIWVINLSCQIWHKPHNVSDSQGSFPKKSLWGHRIWMPKAQGMRCGVCGGVLPLTRKKNFDFGS